jgi:hypothetical protein
MVTAYRLKVGTSPGGIDIYDGSETTNQSQQVINLPTDGSTVYVRLWSKINESWTDNYNDYTYTALKNPPAGTHSYLTADDRIMVIHDTDDEYLYQDCGPDEVSYTMQIIKESNTKYYIAGHSEANKPNAVANKWSGDGLMTAIDSGGGFDYAMPSNRKHALWCTYTDGPSRIWSSDDYDDYINLRYWRVWGGPGNPMVVKGPGDSYYYIHFIACTDTDGNRHLTDHDEGDFSHFLCLARTTDFQSFEIRTELPAPDGICWKPYGVNSIWNRPRALDDTTGSQLTCLKTDYHATETNGMLGSICYYDGKYYFFYCDDIDPLTSSHWHLYYRWTNDVDELVAATSWSSPILANSQSLPFGQKVVVAPAHDMNRWVVVYHALQDNGGPNNIPDICVQYTENMNIVGNGGISSIVFDDGPGSRDSHYLGRQIGTLEPGGSCYQQYFMTDPAGRLAVPNDKVQNATSGGLVTFADHATNGVWGGEVYCMGWDLYVPQATVPTPSDNATSISTSTNLSWDAGYKATYYKVYFGTSSSPPYIGEQVETSYSPTLQSGQIYHWRIDAINGDDAGITQGKVWSFTTQ